MTIHDDLLAPIPDWVHGLFPDNPIKFLRTPDWCGPWVYKEIGRGKGNALRVICTAHHYGDGKRWIHVSCSKPETLPSWQDLRLVKDTFIGRDRKAVFVLPCEAEYVNINPYVLHLYACLDGDDLPDFRIEGAL